MEHNAHLWQDLFSLRFWIWMSPVVAMFGYGEYYFHSRSVWKAAVAGVIMVAVFRLGSFILEGL